MPTPDIPTDRIAYCSYEYGNTSTGNQVEQLIDEGKLPFDTFVRLSAVGYRVVDPHDEGEYPKRLEWNLLIDMIGYADQPESMRPDTRELLWGELPDAVIDPFARYNEAIYAQLDPMYYRLGHLAAAVRRRRQDESQTITEVPDGRYDPIEEIEWGRCVGLARPIWRVMVQRVHPEWLANPEDYYHPTITMQGGVHEASQKTMQRRVVAAAVLSDTVVLDTYNEAVEIGVRGIALSGRESLRYLLTDEHPELF